MYDVWAESNNIWAVGQPSLPTSYNHIIFSSNGGANWSVQTTQNIGNNIMTAIQMLNLSVGYVAGTSGIVLKTVNGGQNWNLLNFPSSNNLRNLKFLDINTGWIVGYASGIYKTTDGGASWFQQIAEGLNRDVSAVSFINSNTGWIVAEDAYFGNVYRTTNGGENWSDQTPAGVASLYDIQMLDENTGYLCGNRTFKKTTSGGVNWEDIATPFPLNLWCSLRFTNSLSGFVAGFFTGTIKTTDGGQSWVFDYYSGLLNAPGIGNSKIHLVSMDTVYAASFSSGVFKYTTPGPIGINEWQTGVPKEYMLYQNYPNPFNPSTTIKFAIPRQGKVTLKVYDITGREVRTILDNLELNPGTVKHTFDGTTLASGIYFYSLYVDNALIETRKMVLIK